MVIYLTAFESAIESIRESDGINIITTMSNGIVENNQEEVEEEKEEGRRKKKLRMSQGI